MALQPIRLFGDPVLRTPAAEVTTFDKELRQLVKDLELLFVGVLQDNYRLDACLQAVSRTPGTRVTLCVRQETWEETREHYTPLLPAGRADVVHRSGSDLLPLYERADLGVLFTEPNPYWDFAVPYKLYEYLAHELPVIAVRGTQTGRLVEGDLRGEPVR